MRWGANGKSAGAAGRAPKARESRRLVGAEAVGFGEGVSPSPMGEGSEEMTVPIPRIFF